MEKKIILKKNTLILILLFFIILVSFILRCININNETGLWVDEIVSIHMAIRKFPLGIIRALFESDVHMPFYFFLLHFWMRLFGDSDVVLRFFSVVCGTLNVPFMYLVGKELNSEEMGLLAALLVGINSFLIYYSQEVRLYSLLAMLVTLALLFFLKVIKKSTKINLTLLAILNILVIFTYTLGIALVSIELLIFGIYIFSNKRVELKKFLLSQIVIPFFLFAIYLPIILKQISIKNCQLCTLNFNWSNLYLYFQNWFSPVILGQYSNFDNYFEIIQSGGLLFWIYTGIPILIAFIAIICALKINNISRWIFFIAFLFFLFEIFLALSATLSIISRYTIIILPLILILVSFGLVSIKNRALSSFLICLFIFVNLFYLLTNKNSALIASRLAGFNLPVLALKQLPLSPKDKVLISDGDLFLKRYYPSKYGQVLSFSSYGPLLLDSKLLAEYNKNNYFFLKDYLIKRKYFASSNKYMEDNVLNKLEKGGFFIVIRNVPFFNKDNDTILNMMNTNSQFTQAQLNNLISNKTLNDIEGISFEHYNYIESMSVGYWSIKVFQNN